MDYYTIQITEILQKQILVNANACDEETAVAFAEELYYNEEEILTAEDLKETKFERLYDIDGSNYTMDQLRQGYREITGLDNDKELSDKQIYEYMLEALKEE